MSRFPSLRDHATVIDVFGLDTALTRPIMEYHEILLRGDSPLTVAERELIAAYVSGVNHCRFCHAAHTAVAERYGIEHGLVAQFLADPRHPAMSTRLRPLLTYVRKLTEQPDSVIDADAQAVFAAGWDERALHHAIHVCALFNFMNRLVEGHGIGPISERIAAQLAEQLHAGGYLQFT